MAKMPSYLSILIWLTPIIASTTFSHFREGPPAKTWTLKQYLLLKIVQTYLAGPSKLLTLKQIQKASIIRGLPLPKYCNSTPVTIPLTYREQGGKILETLFDEKVNKMIGWEWYKDRYSCNEEYKGIWIQPINSNDKETKRKTLLYFHGGGYFLGTYKLYRPLLAKIARLADCNILAVDYRLAPQHSFPIAVEDALAAYLYLLNPPSDSSIQSTPSHKIYIGGDSAGGGLTLALLLTIRDTGLPVPAGGIPISPWADLTRSLPSCASNQITDYLPGIFNGWKNDVPTPEDTLLAMDNNDYTNEDTDYHSLIDDWMEKGQLQIYTKNRCLKFYLVSPIFDKYQLHGLPPLLIQTGDAEQFRDESICSAIKATGHLNSHPPPLNSATHHFTYPSTKVTLDLYVDQPHVFQLLFLGTNLATQAIQRSIENMAEFIRDQPSSVSDPLMIRLVSPDGHSNNVTDDMIKVHAEIWDEWQNNLKHPSLKARMDKILTHRL